jgi:hypothetical protein
MTSIVSLIGIECGARCLVAHRLLAIWRRAGVASVSLTVGRLLVATLVVSRLLVVVHLVGVIVFVVSAVSSRLALRSAAEPAGPVRGLHAASTVSSCDAPVAMCVSMNYD